MAPLRALALSHRRLAALLLAMALALRVLVPAGFMPDAGSGALAMKICADQGSTVTLLVPLKGADHRGDPARADAPCAFAAIGHAVLGGADPLVLALALAFILALGFAPVRRPLVPAWPRRSPPALGPPISA